MHGFCVRFLVIYNIKLYFCVSSIDYILVMVYIERDISPAVQKAALYYPVIVITGPRQVGKSTLCRHLFPDYQEYNFESIALRQAVEDNPVGFIQSCGERVVIDEVQRVPELLSYIQIEVDRNPDRRFVLTGSNNFALMESITQSLAGRAALFTLLPFSLQELGHYKCIDTDQLLLNGLYPGVVVRNIPTDMFYPNYYATYVERDLHQIREISNLSAFQLFVRLLSGRVGSEFNASALATEVGISSPTAKSWFGILQASYIAFPLHPYYANISKRLTKMPKVYFYDTGLLCSILGITDAQQLVVHPLRGAIFENLAVCEVMKSRLNKALRPDIYFYRENSGREVDIVIDTPQGLDIIEVKSSATYHRDFARNIKYLKDLLGDKISHSRIVYDGDPIPPDLINIRQL